MRRGAAARLSGYANHLRKPHGRPIFPDMKIRALTLAAFLAPALLTAPVLFAQDDPEAWQPPLQDSEPAPEEDGGDLIGRGVGILMENFMRELGPGLDQLRQDMSGAFNNLSPVLKDLSVLVDDLRNYEPPERLENGDIVIRRRADAPPPPPIGEDLRNFTTPEDQPDSSVPRDPDAPEIDL
ncbi:hypothetical protein SAMN05421772_102236 [Paracoccus saliphilus]|uniref:AAA+ family ATPase n=2 Tax=Paracoccus saliphilus TaxID=405559 RepID=A0AA45W259_9RHOB|nr:hypothetical protein SAMN05421772_102236 [Paracoccus saliphilus]